MNTRDKTALIAIQVGYDRVVLLTPDQAVPVLKALGNAVMYMKRGYGDELGYIATKDVPEIGFTTQDLLYDSEAAYDGRNVVVEEPS